MTTQTRKTLWTFIQVIYVLSSVLQFRVTRAQVQLQPKPLVGVRGQNLTVTCSFPEDTFLIRPNLDNNNIQEHPRYLGVTLVTNTSAEYRFGPLVDSDNGSVFTCTNLIGSTDSATLNVPFSAQTVNFIVLPSSQNMVEGGNATFECAANDGTQPYTVIWRLRRGSEVVTTISSSRAVSGTGGVIVGTNGSPLVLTSVMRSLNGITVSCVARISRTMRMEQTEPPANLTLGYPPNITMAPTSLDPSAIQTCCAGVKLNLEDPDDPTLVVKVYRNGVLHPNTSREGDNLFIPGLQAGREYTFRVSVKNVFGTSERDVTVTPLLGRPSDPAKPEVTANGTTITVVLSTDYPGTERMRSGSMFSFQLQFTTDGRSGRQSDTLVVSATPSGLSSPVTTTYQGVLSGGSYTVRVTAVNEHGSSESVVSEEFVVTAPVASSNAPVSSLETIIIILAVIIAVLVFLLVISTLYSILATIKLRRGTVPKGTKTSELVYDEMEIKPPSGQTDHEMTMEKNPAYEAVNVGTTTEYEEVGGGRRE